MIQSRKGFTLPQLIAVIVIVTIVIIIAIMMLLTLADTSREAAFRIEANKVLEAAEEAYNTYALGLTSLDDGGSSCLESASAVCFTVEKLVELGLYSERSDNYSGKVIIDFTNPVSLKYTLYLQKGAEFSINGGHESDYTDYDEVTRSGWPTMEDQDSCSCGVD